MLGAIPGLPKVHLHNPVLAYTVGDEFMAPFHRAARGELDNFVLVMEGSIPNEKISGDGYWAAFGTDPQTGEPITIPEWLDRLAPKALAVVTAGTCSAYGGIHAMKGNATGCMGVADYLGWDWKSKAGLPIVNVPGCPVQPDNFMETLLYLLRQLAGLAPMIPIDEAGVPNGCSSKTVHRGLRSRRLLRDRRFCHTNTARPNASSNSAAGVLSCNAMSPSADGWPEWAAAPMSVASASAARCQASRTSSCHSWTSRRARPFRRT